MTNIIKIVATSAFAILAASVFLAISGYIATNDSILLAFAAATIPWIIGGSIVIATLIHGPRFLN